MPSFLDQLSVKQYWKDRASPPVIRGMEARENWLPESEQFIQRLSEFGELLECNLKNMKVLSTAFAKERIAMVLQAPQAVAEENEADA